MTPRCSAVLLGIALIAVVTHDAAAQSTHSASEFWALPNNATLLLDTRRAVTRSDAQGAPRDRERAYSRPAPQRASQSRATSTPAAAPAPSADAQRARALFEHGVQLADQLQWAEAADAFEQSVRLFPRPATLRNLGLAHRALGRYTQATGELQRFLDEGQADPATRAQVEQVISEMRAHLNTIRLAPSVVSAELTLDDRPVRANEDIQADPGSHVIVATAAGHVRTALTVTLGHGERRRIDVRLDRVGGGVFSQWWPWVIVVGAVAVVAGGIIAVAVATSGEEPRNCGTLQVCVTPR